MVTDHIPQYHIFRKKGYTYIRSQPAPEVCIYTIHDDFDIIFVKSKEKVAYFLSRIKVGQAINMFTDRKCLNVMYDSFLFIINWTKIKTQSLVDVTLSCVIRAINIDEWSIDAITIYK